MKEGPRTLVRNQDLNKNTLKCISCVFCRKLCDVEFQVLDS